MAHLTHILNNAHQHRDAVHAGGYFQSQHRPRQRRRSLKVWTRITRQGRCGFQDGIRDIGEPPAPTCVNPAGAQNFGRRCIVACNSSVRRPVERFRKSHLRRALEIVLIVGLKRQDGLNSGTIVLRHINQPREAAVSKKHGKFEVHWKARALPEIRSEDQQLTSFAGLVVFQHVLKRLSLKTRLRGCFEHLKVSPIFGHASILMLLVVNLLIGYRRLSDLRYYRDDPMVKRALGLKRLPDVATASRTLDGMDKTAVKELRRLSRSLVLERPKKHAPARLTLDFDGTVIGTTRMAEGTAVGYNRKKSATRVAKEVFLLVA